MKDILEKVPQRIGASWRYRRITEGEKRYGWHRHDEYEIAIHRHFAGTCFVGHHQTVVEHNHMVLIGPGLPHAIYSTVESSSQYCETHVVWFRKKWINALIELCQELAPMREILFDANRGVQFSSESAESITKLLSTVHESSPSNQLATLFSLFSVLIEDKNRIRLINPIQNVPEKDHSMINEKLEKAEAYLLKNFDRNISLKQLAEHLYVSESSVRRLFHRHFKESFTQHLKKIRLNMACDMLMKTSLPISLIIEKVGFDNQTNFNRQFKAYKRTTPSAFRASMKQS